MEEMYIKSLYKEHGDKDVEKVKVNLYKDPTGYELNIPINLVLEAFNKEGRLLYKALCKDHSCKKDHPNYSENEKWFDINYYQKQREVSNFILHFVYYTSPRNGNVEFKTY